MLLFSLGKGEGREARGFLIFFQHNLWETVYQNNNNNNINISNNNNIKSGRNDVVFLKASKGTNKLQGSLEW